MDQVNAEIAALTTSLNQFNIFLTGFARGFKDQDFLNSVSQQFSVFTQLLNSINKGLVLVRQELNDAKTLAEEVEKTRARLSSLEDTLKSLRENNAPAAA